MKRRGWIGGLASVAASIILFVVPFAFILLTAAKDRAESSRLRFTWPGHWQLWSNVVEVVKARDYMLLTAFVNSAILTVASVTILVILSTMVGYVLQRRPSRWTPVINIMILAGLIIPPAVVPTIWVLQGLQLYRSIGGLILIEVAYGFSFSILLFRAFMSTIPREVDEAAVIDGAGPIRLFFQVILPLLRPVMITVIVVQAVAIFNDFQNPLYFLPGDANATVQVTLYNFKSQFTTQWNLLFADILLITIPPLIMYIFFNRQIVAGLTSGAIKG